MPLIRIETTIEAPPQRCFDLVREVEVHLASTARGAFQRFTHLHEFRPANNGTLMVDLSITRRHWHPWSHRRPALP